jgi:hypothetical protein
MLDEEVGLGLVAQRKVGDVDAKIFGFLQGLQDGAARKDHHRLGLVPHHLHIVS